MGLVLTLQREKSFDLVGRVSKLYFILFSSLMKLHPGSWKPVPPPVMSEHCEGNFIQSRGSS